MHIINSIETKVSILLYKNDLNQDKYIIKKSDTTLSKNQ
jgi:hypothetical protein